ATPAPEAARPEVQGQDAATVELLGVQPSLPTTTVVVEPSPPASSTLAPPDAVPTTTTTVPPTTTLAPVVDAQGAVLVNAARVPRPIDAARGCRSLVDEGWTVGDCGTARAAGADLVWLVQSRSPGGRQIVVLRVATGSDWVPVLIASDDGSGLGDVRARVADVSGDGAEDIVFGFRSRAATPVLTLHVVEGPGRVVVHQRLVRGSARVVGGALETWQPAPDGAQFEQAAIRFTGGAWRRVVSRLVPAGEVPASEL
ncbi:MAG: hypothetical protein ACRD0D_10360, partial [Acidimicrobiales bacterium]